MPRLLIIGGSDAGISAALAARETDPAWTVTVALADEHPNYSICGLPFVISREAPGWEELAHRSRREIEAAGVELLTSHVARALDFTAQRVELAGPGGAASLAYDSLVLATGAESARPPLGGLDLPGVFFMRFRESGEAIDHWIATRQARNAVIIGGGYIGLEMADALRKRGLTVTLLQRSATVLKTVDPPLGRMVAAEILNNGVELFTGVALERVEAREGALAVTGQGGLMVKGDLVLVAAGGRPNTGLASEAGLACAGNGAMVVNRAMETGRPGVWAAGDCVVTYHRLLKANTYLPLGSTAHKQGRVAGVNAVGGNILFEGSLGAQVVKVFDLVVGRSGLSERQAVERGFDPFTVEVNPNDHKAYYPGASPLHIRLCGCRRRGLLLGGQVLGRAGAGVPGRLDVLTVALYHGMSVADLNHLDLCYTPPLSSPWDPVQVAAQAWEAARTRP